jgi:hypothetical protein
MVAFFLVKMGYLFAAESLNVLEVPSLIAFEREVLRGDGVAGRMRYASSYVRNNITERSTLTLSLDFINESMQLDVVSVNIDDSSISYSALGSSSADILTVTESHGAMVGSLIHDGKLYKFKPASNGDTLIIETADDQFAEQAQTSTALAASNEKLIKGRRFVAKGGPDDGSKIDVIVTYTPEFVAEQGIDNVAAYITQLEEETNLSFQLSGVNTKVDIVYSYPTSYSDSTNFTKDANFFLTDDVAEGRELRGLRNQYHADIMVVLTGNSGYDTCGYTPMFEANEANALAVIREVCATGYYQFAHEIGHIFGADHNIEEASGLGVDHAHGYCGTEWRSIMSYHCSTGGGRRLPLWSNPDETFNGEVMGVAGVSNNVKVLNDRALEVSNFRFQVATPDQVTLTSPVGIIVTDTTPIYEWESAERATSYRLKVTDNSGNVLFEESYMTDQVCELNVCSVTPTIGLPFGLINWWIVPENATGEGPESEKGIFAVAPVPRVPEVTTLLAPWGVVSDATPAYSWNAVSISSWYRLLARDGDDNLIIDKWYTAADVNCQSGEGECSVTPDAIITKNPVIWWVQTWNNAGYGDWSESRVFYVYPLP